MTLVVEDGSIVANANSYVSLDEANAYHASRGDAGWTGTDAVKEAAILRAMGWLESQPWVGRPYQGPVGASDGQRLQWPRVDVTLSGHAWPWDEVHPGVQSALCEAALVELTDPGALSESFVPGVKREKLGAIETEYFTSAAGNAYPALAHPLRGLLRSGGSVELVRG